MSARRAAQPHGEDAHDVALVRKHPRLRRVAGASLLPLAPALPTLPLRALPGVARPSGAARPPLAPLAPLLAAPLGVVPGVAEVRLQVGWVGPASRSGRSGRSSQSVRLVRSVGAVQSGAPVSRVGRVASVSRVGPVKPASPPPRASWRRLRGCAECSPPRCGSLAACSGRALRSTSREQRPAPEPSRLPGQARRRGQPPSACARPSPCAGARWQCSLVAPCGSIIKWCPLFACPVFAFFFPSLPSSLLPSRTR